MSNLKLIVVGVLTMVATSCRSTSGPNVSSIESAAGMTKVWCGGGVSAFTVELPSDPSKAKKIKFSHLQIADGGGHQWNVMGEKTTDHERMPTSAEWKNGMAFALPDVTIYDHVIKRTVIIQPEVFKGKYIGESKKLDARVVSTQDDEKSKSFPMWCQQDNR